MKKLEAKNARLEIENGKFRSEFDFSSKSKQELDQQIKELTIENLRLN